MEARASSRKDKGLSPLLIHFDVNKTVIQSDSIQTKTIEEGIREGIAELFWGHVESEGDKQNWIWTRGAASCSPPEIQDESDTRPRVTYAKYCKQVLKMTVGKMQLPPEIRNTAPANEAGLVGSTLVMFPAVFHLVAALQRSKRTFGLLFRSFGADHESIKREWNAFCEMKHPIFSRLIQGIGPMDGSLSHAGVPDRRIHSLHTLYRDTKGSILILDRFTNGPAECTWDSWAKQKPKAAEDTRNGREWIQKVLKAETRDGHQKISQWMKEHLVAQKTSAIKDDWAWWTWHGEEADYGKLLTVIPGKEEVKQLFFDDNIDHEDARIVDCRDTVGNPMPFEETLNKLCTKVNPVEAFLDNEYFLRKLQVCHGDHLEMGASLVEFQRQLAELEEMKDMYFKQVTTLQSQLANLTEENRRMKLRKRIAVRDELQLRDMLSQQLDLESFGKDGRKSLSDLFQELEQGLCWLEQDEHGGIVRTFEMCFMRIQYKDLILIETHEQDSASRIQSRNYLPGVRKGWEENSFEDAFAEWFESGLQVNIKDIIHVDSMPTSTPEAPSQQTRATQAYPIPCKVQMSLASYSIPERASETHKELLGKIGLPAGKHFTTTEKDRPRRTAPSAGDSAGAGREEGTVTRFWRWDKVATWEATTAKAGAAASQVDIAQICEKLFRGHPRKEVYENLLLQMFETFTAKKLCGGFSGSIVIRVQPFEPPDGRPGEPCIVKLDDGKAIREEYRNSENVFRALPDRAARILGDAVYARNKAGEEFGAMRLELAGACWNVPELAQGSANLLSTFKDLLLYESEQFLLDSSTTTGDARPFGNVNSVLAETFGPGGIVSSLRKGPAKSSGEGLRRASGSEPTPSLPWGWYTLKGKPTKWNPFTAKADYPPEPTMKELYRRFFGAEMPDLMDLVIGQIKPKLEKLGAQAKKELCPLIGLAHGDLNAANIMIDALDAVWLIDFATSVDLPLFTDMCKFENACLFEYSTIPLTPKVFLDFATTREDSWSMLNVGDWIRVDQPIAEAFLRKLIKLDANTVATMTQSHLDRLIDEVAAERPPHKRREVVRHLKARLTTSEIDMEGAFKYCATISKTLIHGEYVFESLNIKVPPPEGNGAGGAASLRFFVELTSAIRRFMSREVQSVLKEFSPSGEEIEPCDASSLQMWLPILRETFRIPGYRDIAPQHKVWAIYHCSLVSKVVLAIVNKLESTPNLRDLQIMKDMKHDIQKRRNTQLEREVASFFQRRDPFSEGDSHWIFAHKDSFAQNIHHDRMVRKVHAECLVHSEQPGLFAPIYQVLGSEDKDGNEPSLGLSFGDNGGTAPWKLYLPPVEESGHGSRSPLELEDDGEIGWVIPSPGKPVVILKSRLLFLSNDLLRRNLSDLGSKTKSMDHSFCFMDWSEGLKPSKAMTLLRLGPKAEKERKECAHDSLQRSASGIPSETFQELIRIEAQARDSRGTFMLACHLVLGCSALCYPRGAKLCIDCPAEDLHSNEAVVVDLDDTGCYVVQDTRVMDAQRDFDPYPGNHVFLKPCLYSTGAKIVVAEEHNTWVDAEVIETASESTAWRHRLLITGGVSKQVSWMRETQSFQTQASFDLDRQGSHKVLLSLSTMTSGVSSLAASNYEEEVHKMKVYYRARHSFIIDALSGNKIDVKSCALPTLCIVSGPSLGSGSNGEETLRRPFGFSSESPVAQKISQRVNSMSVGAPSLRRKTSFNEVRPEMESMMSGIGIGRLPHDNRNGWNILLSAVQNYERAMATCTPNAFLVLGSPGSGKTCLICRLIMDCLDRQRDLVPVLLTVTDLVKRTDQEPKPEDGDAALQMWFDKYLRITFGEDSHRYRMVRQAMCMHRVMFLFEGLEDAGNLARTVERLIRDLVLDRHLVVVTSRPLLAGQSSLEGLRDYMFTLKLMHLTNEQKRSIAHLRLSGNITSYDRFMKRMRQGQEGILGDREEDIEAGEKAHEDVFGNPMMLSMLICYLQPSQDKAETEGDDATLTAVYRVALDVMLQRVQSKQQADRHNKDEKVRLCKRVLEKMAITMQQQKRVEIEAGEFERGLDPVLKQGWGDMMDAVKAGHAMFLRTSRDGDRLELRFLVRGFQSYFAASEVSQTGGRALPELEVLLTETWWAEMLDMLAEAAPKRYVKLVEDKLEHFKPKEGNSFLHLAADKGHRPMFQVLDLFSEAHQGALHQRNAQKQTPLHLAAAKGWKPLCALMLERKAEVDAEDAAERKPMHMAMQHGHFNTARFLLDRWTEANKGSNKQRGKGVRDNPAEKLAARLLGSGPALTEEEFKVALEESFPELKFFGRGDEVDKNKSIGALMSVFWIAANHYEKFVRGQKVGPLTDQSWENLQEWTQRTVQLTSSPAKVGAMLVITAVQAVGKIKPFRQAFAPDYEDFCEALASVLQKDPVLIPSFSKLDENWQHMIISTLKAGADFNFGQFLQAENLPASLENVKKILGDGESSATLLGFFLFRIFAMMCGLFAGDTCEGSVFMNQTQYSTFKVGLDVVHFLTKETSQEVYDRLLAARASTLGINFEPENKESRAQVRLACLSRAKDAARGAEVCEAFRQLTTQQRRTLSEYLTADGINQKGFLLYHSPDLMANAAANPVIGLSQAMKMLLRVYQLADKDYSDSEQRVITIYVENLAKHAKTCSDTEVFSFTQFDIKRASGHKSDSQGSVHLSPWQLETSTNKLENYAVEGESLALDVITKALREAQFQKKLSEVFPELAYCSDGDDLAVRKVYRQTVCALSVIYWAASDQFEAFTRGQPPDEKLSERSWKIIGTYLEPIVVDNDALNMVLVAVMLTSVGKIPKLRQQLAPLAKGHQQVLAHILQACPKVLPSFMRLEPQLRGAVREYLTRQFEFQQFLHAENLPASLVTIKDMLESSDMRRQVLNTFLVSSFAEVAGSLGGDSLEGSICMTEERFKSFNNGMEAMRLLADGSDVHKVYDRLLESSAKTCGLHFDPKDPQSRAMVRLACLAKASGNSGEEEVRKTFNELNSSQRAALIKFLNADGIREKPGFVLCDSPHFLASARANSEVGLLPATRILLRVYESAAKEFHGSSASVITIQLGKLTTFAKEFFGTVAFQDLHFSLERQHETEALVVPKVWIPVSSSDLLSSLGTQSMELASDVLKNKISEESFKSRISRIFPEVNYFDAFHVVQRDQTLAAMLSVYWLLSDHHEAFIRNQKQDEQLSKQSWAWIQEWMQTTVKLSTPEVLDATLVFMAIHALGKIKEFREEFSTGFSAVMHDIALAHILTWKPEVVPSFSRLSKKYQELVVDSLSVDFQFSQFLQAENTPANLVVIKEKMKKHGDEGFAFFCFRIFAQTCGKLGSKSLKGSEFMNESQFQRFRPGLEALMELKTRGALETYNNFLLLRGSKAMSRFASPEHQALSRLLTLSASYDHQAGHAVCEAFDVLTNEERGRLTRWLNSDGIRPGQSSYVLCDAPRFLANSKVNRNVGLPNALRMLLRVQQQCAAELMQSIHTRVIINLGSLAEWAKDAGQKRGDFLQAQLTVRSETTGDAKIMTIEVTRPAGSRSLIQADFVHTDAKGSCGWCGQLHILLLLSFICNALALCLNFSGTASAFLLPGGGRSTRGPAAVTLSLLSVLLGLLLAWRCIADRSSCREGAVSMHETGPRQPFLNLETWSLHPRALSRNARHQYSRLLMEEDDTV